MSKQRAEEIFGRMSQLVEPAEDWHEIGYQGEPLFNSGFSNTGGVFETAAYRREGKVLQIKGRIDHSSNMNGQVAFQITDEDYIPNNRAHHGIGVVVSGTWTGGIIDIDTSGNVSIYGTGTITVATINSSFYLDN